jgi:hypothetical protein
MSMELSWVTKALLWALSKRSDIGQINLHEADEQPEMVALTPEEYSRLVSALGFEFESDELNGDGGTAALGLAFDREHLQDCFDAPSANPTDRSD